MIPPELQHLLAPVYNGPDKAPDMDLIDKYGPYSVCICRDGALRWWSNPAEETFILTAMALLPVLAWALSVAISLCPLGYVLAAILVFAAVLGGLAYIFRDRIKEMYLKQYILGGGRDCYEIKDDVLTIYHFDYPYIDDISQFFSGCYGDENSDYWLDTDRKHYFLYTDGPAGKAKYEELREAKKDYHYHKGRFRFVFIPQPQIPGMAKYDLRQIVSIQPFLFTSILVKFSDSSCSRFLLSYRKQKAVMAFLAHYLPPKEQQAMLRRICKPGGSVSSGVQKI